MSKTVTVQFTGALEFADLITEMQEDFGIKDQKKNTNKYSQKGNASCFEQS